MLAKLDAMEETCALDIADEGPISMDQIAEHIGTCKSKVGQILAAAIKKMQKHQALREEYED